MKLFKSSKPSSSPINMEMLDKIMAFKSPYYEPFYQFNTESLPPVSNPNGYVGGGGGGGSSGGPITSIAVSNPGSGYGGGGGSAYPGSPLPNPRFKIFAGIGSREVPEDIYNEIVKFSSKMAEKGWILRSGGAEGCDEAFEKGYENYPKNKMIYLPWKGFNNNNSEFNVVTKPAMELAEKYHPAWNKCDDSAKKLLARDSYQILGLYLDDPCNLVVCWTLDENSGGTSQALRIAKAYNIRIINLAKINK
jgi:hypothetical protein